MVGTATAKSLYMVSEHHRSFFDAWNINPDGTATGQTRYTLTHSTDPAGVALDMEYDTAGNVTSATLFVSSEFSGGVELVDAITMTPIGVSSGPSNLAGLAVDGTNNIVYALRRSTDDLYAYDWNPVAKTLTLKGGYPINLPGCRNGFGISLDDTADILWVADAHSTGGATAYNVGTWTEDASLSFTPSHQPIDIDVDRKRGLVYTTSMTAGAGTPSGTGSFIISKYDLATGVETTQHIGHGAVGVAVDEVNGYVYVTGSPRRASGYTGPVDNMEVWDPSTTPWTLIQQTQDLGNPAGICIPKGVVAYNPLNLAKNDTYPGYGVPIGQTFTYKISYDNLGNAVDATSVTVVDTLPPELDYVSSNPAGLYDIGMHTVTWDLGTLPAGSPGGEILLDVFVNPGAIPNQVVYNYCTISSDQTPATTVEGRDPDNPTPGEPGTLILPLPPADLWMVEYRWSTDPNHQPPYTMTVNADGTVTLDAYMEARIENQGSGDAYNVTATISDAPGYVTIIDGDVTFGDVPAGTSDWSDDDYHINLVCRGPTDDMISWDIEYDDMLGNHHVVVGVPEFPPAPPIADLLPQLQKMWIPDPIATRLYPNYPNPFNPETWIPYQLATDADVTLRIFDTRGLLIKTIALGSKEAGFYTGKSQAAYWDGRNEFGESVGSGVYYYNLHAGKFAATRKMVILK
jgi:uncharacterized repeat protein (TIGR01451 family)